MASGPYHDHSVPAPEASPVMPPRLLAFLRLHRAILDALLADDTIERAARAMNLEAGRQRGLAFEDDWDEITEQERGGWRLCARAALTAAATREA